MRKVPPFSVAVVVALLTIRMAFSQVVVSEIHYHPVEEAAFNSNGTPVLDLTEDIHEFVEIQNTSGAAIDLSGWTLAGGIDFTFPPGTTIQANGYRVVAKNPSRLATVYGLNVADVLGPYSGQLGNNRDTVRIRNAQGNAVDSVDYSATFPWPASADALGAGKDFLGYDALVAPYSAQYKGRSLQRISTTAQSSDPANWGASPWPGAPSPGSPNPNTRGVPKPVIKAFGLTQVSDEAVIIRANQPVRVTCSFTSTESVTDVQVEYWVDNIESFTEARTSITMASLGNGQYSAQLPGQADRSVVRFRFRANLGEPSGLESVSPRDDDIKITPVSATTREAWHSYFVTPVRAASPRPEYDFFISSANVTKLTTNISQNPRRTSSPDPPGYPRDEPFVPSSGFQWNGVVPAIFVSDNQVFDIVARFHGSRYRRSATMDSWKFHFPRTRLFNGMQRLLITEKGSDSVLGFELFHQAGLLSSYSRFVDFYKNGQARLQRLEITDSDEETFARWAAEQSRWKPDTQEEPLGVIYKAKGQDSDEGPYGFAHGRRLLQRTAGSLVPGSLWTPRLRYEWNYPLQNSDWVGHVPFETMINGLWTARGDFNSPGTNLNVTALRNWLIANWDVDTTLTYLAVRNWSCPWDDKFHNYFVWQRANGKWTMAPWDFDSEFSGQSSTASIFQGKIGDPANNTRGPNYFKDSVLQAFPVEFRRRMFLLNNTLLHPSNIQAITAQRGISLDSAWVNARFASVNSQCGLGVFQRPEKPTSIAPVDGASAFPPSALQASAYAHSNTATPSAHTSTRWELRTASGSFREPIFAVTSSSNLTSLPIPFERLTFGMTYFWRCTYFDAEGHPSLTSDEAKFIFGQVPVAKALINLDDSTEWRFNQTSNLDNENWAAPGYDDSLWPTGKALFYVEPDPVPEIKRTPLTIGRNTYYFRTRFNFPGNPLGTTLRLRHVVDDGIVVYLNGAEVWRRGMPTGPVNYSTPASRTIGEAAYEPVEGWFDIPSNSLVSGENVVAVEVHQVNGTSSDVVFGLQLEADVANLAGDLVINEVMADNRSSVANGDGHPDWIELFNSSLSVIDLSGMSLSDDILVPGKFVFPGGTTIPPLGYLVVWCDNNTTAPGLHTGFGLDRNGQTVALFSGQTVKDFVTFGPQIRDLSIARVSNGTGGFKLATPTPNASNVARTPLGSGEGLKINEWMAAPLDGEDWFEIYNNDPNPVALEGLYLSDSLSSSISTWTRIPSHSFVAGKGFVRFEADGTTEGGSHANFKLSTGGDAIFLTAANGATAIDSVSFGAQLSGASQGRLPDGAAQIVSFPQTPTPADSNYLQAPVVINEVLTNSALPFEDAVELYNPGIASADIGGWWLSDDKSNLKKYAIATGSQIGAGAYLVLYENQFNPTPGQGNSFSLSSLGEELFLSATDAAGNLTGYRAQVKFGGAIEGVSFGRIVNGNGPDFFPQIGRTFGQDNPSSLTQFRTGTGLANVGPKIGTVIINEIMYHPPDLSGGVDNIRNEYIELHNITTSPQNVGGWSLKDAVEFIFPENSAILPGDYVLVVGFDPANAADLAAFRTAYGLSANVPIYGPYSPKLSNSSASVELAFPGVSAGDEIPEILIDRTRYSDGSPWPVEPDGTGFSLQRISRVVYGNDPANWSAGIASPGGVNAGQQPIADSDGDGLPDTWEIANGLNSKNAADAAGDYDGDGHSNIQEFIAGTSASDARDFFRADVAPSSSGGFVIRFAAKPGKSYTIQFRDELHAGNWQKLSEVAPSDSTRMIEVADSAPGKHRFYRVVTPAVP